NPRLADTMIEIADPNGGSFAAVASDSFIEETDSDFETTFRAPAEVHTVILVSIPRVGLPIFTSEQIQIDPSKVNVLEKVIAVPASFGADPQVPPKITSVRVEFATDGTPELVLTGKDFKFVPGGSVASEKPLVVTILAPDNTPTDLPVTGPYS